MRARDRIVRQWRIVVALQARRRGLTRRELEDLTGTSRSTVRRDLLVLEEAGFPLRRERVSGQVRYCLPADTCGIALAPTEIAALFLARQMLEPLDGLQMVEALDRLLRRLGQAAGVVPPVGSTNHGSSHRGAVRALDLAIRNGSRLSFAYRPVNDEPARRLVDPVSIRLHRGHAYLVGFDIDRQDWRVFKVSRIQGDLELSGKASPHPDYDEQMLFRHSVGIWSGDPIDVVIRLAPEVAGRADEYRLTGEQTVELADDGAATVRASVSGLTEVLRWVLAWGPAAEVIEPSELRAAVRHELSQALAHYGEKAQSGSDPAHTGEQLPMQTDLQPKASVEPTI